MVTTASPRSISNSSILSAAIYRTLPSQKAESSGWSDSSMPPCWHVGMEGLPKAPLVAAWGQRNRASGAVASAATALFSALSASAMSRWAYWRFRFRWSTVALAASRAR